jgi:hypothetical protein
MVDLGFVDYYKDVLCEADLRIEPKRRLARTENATTRTSIMATYR